jgi:GT2 family glycosyltransferase
VDNLSGDDSPTIIRAWLAKHEHTDKVLLVQSPVNSGFAGGNNTGIKALAAKLYLLLNSDTLIRPGAIRTMLDTAKRFPEAGLISPRLEWPDGQGQGSCFRFHTPFSELMASARTGLIDRFLKRYVVGMPVQEQITHPEWTSFACVLIRREVFDEIGLLDDGYFMYFEDVEFCHRARNAGWSIAHNPDARVVHLRGGSSPVKESTRLRKRLPRYFHESRSRFFYQLYGWPGLTAANIMWWLGRLVSKAQQVFIGRSDKTAIEKQWLDIWINWFNPLRPYTPPKPRN